jgi:broad specificity phosphatase PhoE
VLTILLTRHGHTDQSDPDRYLGQRVPGNLSERGRRDADALAARLDGVPIDRIISSPLERAFDTARIIASRLSLEVEPDARLTELDYGTWEGMTVEEVQIKLPADFADYDADPSTYRVGGGECGADAAARSAKLVDDLLAWAEAANGHCTCLLVGHSSVNRALMAAVLGVPLKDYRRRFQQDWTSLTVLRWANRDSGPLLLLANDLAHVRGVSGVTWD